MSGDLGQILGQILTALKILGDAVSSLISYIFAALGLPVPPILIQLAGVITLVLVIWRLGGEISRFALLVALLLLVGMSAGLLGGILSHIPFLGW